MYKDIANYSNLKYLYFFFNKRKQRAQQIISKNIRLICRPASPENKKLRENKERNNG